MTELDNIQRWDGARRGFYEVWYLTLSHRPSQTGFWIRYTLEAPLHDDPYAQLWFARFDARAPGRTFGIHQNVPIAALSSQAQPFAVRIGPDELGHGSARGRVAGAGHEASWDLSWQPCAETHHHLPELMYRRGGLGETTVLSPNLDIALHGSITVDGQRYELAGEPGGQTHLWGRKHANAWAWAHCNAFVDRPGACIEALSVDLVRARLPLPRLTLFTLYLDGQRHRFTQFRQLLATGAEHAPGRFLLHGRSRDLRIEASFTCRPEDMLVAPYVDPDGAPCWCVNTEVADVRVVVHERAALGRWRKRDVLEAPRLGHFEVGSHEQPRGIGAEHVLVPWEPVAHG
jgi:hypothetical protein